MEVCRLLKPGGKLLLDLIHREYARQKFTPSSWHEANEDVVVCRRRKLLDDGIVVREMALSKDSGLIRDATYFARLFRYAELEALLKESGFQQINRAGSLASQPRVGDYGLLSNRMLVTARRPNPG